MRHLAYGGTFCGVGTYDRREERSVNDVLKSVGLTLNSWLSLVGLIVCHRQQQWKCCSIVVM